MRYTPAGLPALDLELKHESTVSQDGQPRKVSFEIAARAEGAITGPLTALEIGSAHGFAGFLGARLSEQTPYAGLLAGGATAICGASAALALYGVIGKQRLSQAQFALTLVGLGISIWPDVIPGRVTIWEAAAPPASQAFMLVGAVVLIPLILAYTAWSYWVFRGKVGEEGYH